MGALSCFVFICQVDGFCLLQDLQGWQTILPQSQCFHHSWCLDHVKSHFFHHGWCFNHLKSNVFQQFMCDFPLRSPFLHIFAGFFQVFPWISHIFPWISHGFPFPKSFRRPHPRGEGAAPEPGCDGRPRGRGAGLGGHGELRAARRRMGFSWSFDILSPKYISTLT